MDMEFKCKIITPMFLSGANQSRPELRVPSFKGGIQYWWRAMCTLPFKEMKQREQLIFGDTKRRSQVLFRLRYEKSAFNKLVHPNGSKKSIDSIQNLFENRNRKIEREAQEVIGYITYGTDNQAFILPSDDFEFTLIVKCHEAFEEEVKNAFLMMAYFGGIGGKARNGLGSFKVLNYPFNFLAHLKKFMQEAPKNFTAANFKMRLFETKRKNYKDWESLLVDLATAYRSSKKSFDLSKDQRKYIGFTGKGILDIQRHAKSHFFNIIQNDDGSYKGLVLHIPYLFLQDMNNDKAEQVREMRGYNKAQLRFNDLLADQKTLEQISL